jgi:uncharacterized protein (TIGR02646 family)
MIKLKKPRIGPDILDKNGVSKIISETNSNNNLYDASSNEYIKGTISFDFKSKIYGNKKIKKQLVAYQFGKCAFCEQNVLSTSYGDVEHFRPKGGFRQSNNNQMQFPGYYWLAYDWNNLLFSCSICNQRFKKNLFPILNSHQRARNHYSSLVLEKPVFINPYDENPKFLIGFNEEVAQGKDKRGRGDRTIDALGLNRKGNGFSDLIELRRDHFDTVEQIYITSRKTADAQTTQAQIDKAIELMNRFRSKKKQFSAMINDNFQI